jgi:2-polyprenyl-3-methyl-5-hydroxy-6-metoxy-1,4-benzoquinol methylase
MSRLDSVAKRVQAAFAGAPRSERLHVAGRLRSCPVEAVAEATPASGRVLDFGCGHGAVTLYLALTAPDRQMTGLDVDAEKLQLARAAATNAGVEITFAAVETDSRPTGTWDAITIVDVLYLLGEKAAMDVVDHAAAALAPGGVIVVKEVDVRPRWKYWLASVQEFAATKILRITEGSSIHFVPPDVIGQRLLSAGLRVEHRPAHRGRLHPHHLIIGFKPA